MVCGEEDVVTERLDFAWVYGVTPLATFRMVTRLEFLDENARQLGHQGFQVLELREREGVFRSISERRVDPELAAWGPRFFAGKNMVKRSQFWQPASWDGARNFDETYAIDGISVAVSGGGGVVPVSATSTRYTLSLTLETSGRVAGRKLESGVAAALGAGLEAEHEFRLRWLGRQVQHGF
jgi:hypothetical protein